MHVGREKSDQAPDEMADYPCLMACMAIVIRPSWLTTRASASST
jgi:hypothetical protein